MARKLAVRHTKLVCLAASFLATDGFKFKLFQNACMVYKHAYLHSLLLLHSAFMLRVVKMPLKVEVGGHASNSHGNYIVDHEKSWKNHGIVFLNFCGNPLLLISSFCLSYRTLCWFCHTKRTRTHSMARHRKSPRSQRNLTVIDPLTLPKAPGGRDPKNCAGACAIHVSNSHTKSG